MLRLLTGWPVVLVLLAGCGGGRTAAVSGKVTYQGKAVTGGSLTFTPVAASGDREPGKSGEAEVQTDAPYDLEDIPNLEDAPSPAGR